MAYVRNVVRAPPRTLSPSDQQLLLRVTGEHVDGFRDHVTYSLALGTALRESELAALDIVDVYSGDEKVRREIVLRRFKGSERAGEPEARQAQQRVFIPRAVRLKLEKYVSWKDRRGESVKPGAPLFVSRFGLRISARQMRTAFARWQNRAGIERPINFHGLRHTSLSTLYRRTKDLLLVQQQARHAHATTTEIYAHVSDDDIRQAVEELPA